MKGKLHTCVLVTLVAVQVTVNVTRGGKGNQSGTQMCKSDRSYNLRLVKKKGHYSLSVQQTHPYSGMGSSVSPILFVLNTSYSLSFIGKFLTHRRGNESGGKFED